MTLITNKIEHCAVSINIIFAFFIAGAQCRTPTVEFNFFFANFGFDGFILISVARKKIFSHMATKELEKNPLEDAKNHKK